MPPVLAAGTPSGNRSGSTRTEWETIAGGADSKNEDVRIKALRKARHWPQKQLALPVGVRYEQLNKYEGGFHIPAVETLVRLADALDTTVDYLITGTQVEDSNLANVRLFRRFQALEHMAEDNQQTVIRIIDAMIAQRNVTSALVPVD